MERYTFDNYLDVDRYRSLIKQRAIDYSQDSGDGWWYIYGQSGSGKTHICTAICKSLMDSGLEVYYMNWRDESVVLKADINDSETYTRKMDKLKSVKVLYIDDFLKGGSTVADIKLAFEILNARYSRRLKTIISSEITLDGLFEIDEAVAGRIFEMSARPRYLVRAAPENYRKRMMAESGMGDKNDRQTVHYDAEK